MQLDILVLVVLALTAGANVQSKCPECTAAIANFKPCSNPGPIEKPVCDALHALCDFFVCPADDINDHMPVSDRDGDLFSTSFGGRGAAWRGKDCDDSNNKVYPGRKVGSDGDKTSDTNCNGIKGGNASGTYEDLFCSSSEVQNLILLSDSTGAHFGIPIKPFGGPAEWAKVTDTEFDWPECSWSTAHADVKQCEPHRNPSKKVDSFYLRLLERNRCRHRHFQNIAVNGMRSGPMYAHLVNTTASNPSDDVPSLVFYAEVANDVCNPHPGMSHMTTPEEYYTNVVNSLKHLDTVLAEGSHVVFLGYFHGETIHDVMKDKPYPYFGMTYAEAWEFVSNQTVGKKGDTRSLNPCYGWLTPNATLRHLTTVRANALNAVYGDIISKEKFTSFDMRYMDNPDGQIIKDYMATGKDVADLFETVGGAHPSQTGSGLWAEYIWRHVETTWPELLGPINPHNEEIHKMFGDQGGY